MLRLTQEEFEKAFGTARKKSPKYRNKKCEWHGIVFDSIKERDRFIILEASQNAGEISELKRQVRYQLIPDQYENGKLVERGVDYIADFTYRTAEGTFVVEDTKGFITKEYIIKRKLMRWLFGIAIQQI